MEKQEKRIEFVVDMQTYVEYLKVMKRKTISKSLRTHMLNEILKEK